MSGTAAEITDYLRGSVALRRHHGGNLDARARGFHYTCIEDFVLREGRAFEPKPKPVGVRYGQRRQCFRNSYRVAVTSAAGLAERDAGRFRYCEGYATALLTCEHAWLLDTEDGYAFDVTWRWDGGRGAQRGSPASDAVYFGVEIPLSVLLAATGAKGTYGVLDHLPILREPWKRHRPPAA